jgi:hypothetical protein
LGVKLLPSICPRLTSKGLCWLELRSRYLFEIGYRKFDNARLKAIRLNIFNMMETVFGIKLAVVLCTLLTVNILTLHCLVVKWFNVSFLSFFIDLVNSPRNFTYPSCTQDTNRTGLFENNSTFFNPLRPTNDFSLNELLINFFFFLYLLIKLKYPTKQVNTVIVSTTYGQPSNNQNNLNRTTCNYKFHLECIWAAFSFTAFINLFIFPIKPGNCVQDTKQLKFKTVRRIK